MEREIEEEEWFAGKYYERELNRNYACRWKKSVVKDKIDWELEGNLNIYEHTEINLRIQLTFTFTYFLYSSYVGFIHVTSNTLMSAFSLSNCSFSHWFDTKAGALILRTLFWMDPWSILKCWKKRVRFWELVNRTLNIVSTLSRSRKVEKIQFFCAVSLVKDRVSTSQLDIRMH